MQRNARVTVGGMGIHTRPAAMIVETLTQRFPDRRPQVRFRVPSWTMQIDENQISGSSWQELDPFSILNLLSASLDRESVFEVVCSGEQADEAFEVLRALFTEAPEDTLAGEFFSGTRWEELHPGESL
ncbi:MAG TPA: HPr family phosphocarrier protein [Gemmataceae bacterium]|nr:HPr family phosphocarrier protein [Gemmataceae bacterium]